MNKLQLNYKLLRHRYIDEPSSVGEVWAWIEMKIIDKNSDFSKILFSLQWDIKVFLEWFIENKLEIMEGLCPILSDEPSIAKNIYDFKNNNQDVDLHIDMYENIYTYRYNHSIGVALSGTDVKSFIIGKHNEKYQVSRYSESEKWYFEIDIIDFYKQIDKIYSKIKLNPA
jgi:hypothetical protein